MSAAPPVSVTVVREFRAAPGEVFDAWLRPDLIGRWMFGPALRDEEIVHLEVDARVGGAFSFLVRRQGAEIDHIGRYLEIERPRRLVFTWGIAGASADESRVILEIAPRPAGCELRLTHEMQPEWAEYAERTRAGWTRMLDELARISSDVR